MSDVPDRIRRAREMWRFTGSARPDFAFEPGEGQESVWDYPRPPRLEEDGRRVQVFCEGTLVADTQAALRVLETASPPVFYIPPADIRTGYLQPGSGSSMCEWKGRASYWTLRVGETTIEEAAWSYADPFAGYDAIAGCLSFYPAKVECRVAGERVRPQPGGFYGGWVTPEVVGPFKGDPGTGWW